MYRPKGLENPYNFMNGGAIPHYENQSRAWEEGAVAMLEAIRGLGFISGASLRVVEGAIGWAGIDPNSKWYPIPEEEE